MRAAEEGFRPFEMPQRKRPRHGMDEVPGETQDAIEVPEETEDGME